MYEIYKPIKLPWNAWLAQTLLGPAMLFMIPGLLVFKLVDSHPLVEKHWKISMAIMFLISLLFWSLCAYILYMLFIHK